MIRKWIIVFSILAMGVSASSCGQKSNGQKDKQEVTTDLSAQEFAANIQTDSNIQVVDVRTWGEYMQSHLKNAVWIDYYKSDFKEKINVLDKTKPVYLYCATGRRSYDAMQMLNAAGFTAVYHLNGGISAWKNENLPTTRN